MQITYLGHSGFLVETEKAYYLFDYIRGTLPDFSKEKPLYVFASHSHEDHFDPIIFQDALSEHAEKYLLSSDILRKYKRRPPVWLSQNEKTIEWVSRGGSYEFPEIKVETLFSTDIGVAFVIREKNGVNLYHAGDLNWWHWEGEEKSWNRNMEVNYKREIDKLRGETFAAAFVPLDPRLEQAYWYGLGYFVDQISGADIFPMHFWKEYSIIPRYLKEHPIPGDKKIIIHQIRQEDEHYEI